jgi:hypothetical protein
MKAALPMSTTIRQIEFELEKAEHGMSMPYDAERVIQLRRMLRDARKQKLSAGLRARREKTTDDHPHHARCHRPGYPADAVQVAPRSQGLVQDALSRLADQGERPEACCIQDPGSNPVP